MLDVGHVARFGVGKFGVRQLPFHHGPAPARWCLLLIKPVVAPSNPPLAELTVGEAFGFVVEAIFEPTAGAYFVCGAPLGREWPFIQLVVTANGTYLVRVHL